MPLEISNGLQGLILSGLLPKPGGGSDGLLKLLVMADG